MKKKLLTAMILLLIGAGVWYFRADVKAWFIPSEHELVLYGNVDNRQLDLSFLISERIAELVPEEGSLIRKGDLIGSQETVRIKNDIAAAKANIASCKAAVEAARATYEKARNGSRLEDIAMARSGMRQFPPNCVPPNQIISVRVFYKEVMLYPFRSEKLPKRNTIF